MNLIFPLLNGIDSLLFFLPAVVRIALYGLICGAASILVYKWTSNQAAIGGLKTEAKALRDRLLDPNLSGTELKQTIFRNTKVSGLLVGRVLGPSLLSAVPVLLIAGWLALFYAYQPPSPGTPVTAVPVGLAEGASGLVIEAGQTAAPLLADGASFEAGPATEVTVRDEQATYYTGTPFDPAMAGVGKRAWWNAILESETGYVADDAPFEAVEFDLEPVVLVPVLPTWLAGWEMVFFVAVFIAAIGLKVGLKIE